MSLETENHKNEVAKPMKKQEKSNFQRVEAYLEQEYEIRYNEVSNDVEFTKKGSSEKFQSLNTATIYRELEHNGFKISISNLETLICSDFVPIHNPIKDYFISLPEWNVETDMIEKLANHVQAVDQQRFNYHLKKALIRTVAGVFQQDYFNKHAFILVGKQQNTGKTTFLRFLCPDELSGYFTENISTTDKDGLICLSENFMINLDELAMLGKSDINKLKSMFSMSKVKVRHPFGKKAQITPRRASFFGSTNDDDFLIDSSGSVRWLCFEINKINFDYSLPGNIEIEQVWAQAYHLFRINFSGQLTKQDLLENEIVNNKFRKNSIEYDLIQANYWPGNEVQNDGFYTPTQFLEYLSPKAPFSRLTPEKIGKALVALGYTKQQKRVDQPYPVYGYYFRFRTENENS